MSSWKCTRMCQLGLGGTSLMAASNGATLDSRRQHGALWSLNARIDGNTRSGHKVYRGFCLWSLKERALLELSLHVHSGKPLIFIIRYSFFHFFAWGLLILSSSWIGKDSRLSVYRFALNASCVWIFTPSLDSETSWIHAYMNALRWTSCGLSYGRMETSDMYGMNFSPCPQIIAKWPSPWY